MPTIHRAFLHDARCLDELEKDSVELVVTAPPTPMVELWDDIFIELNIEIADAFEDKDPNEAFQLMHTELKKVWSELERVLVDGGIACIVSRDVFRQVNGEKQSFKNTLQITEDMEDCGFTPLPSILWHTPSEPGVPTVGSGGGVLPPNRYPTVDTQEILIFRNHGERLDFNTEFQQRSACFSEESQQWFENVWTGLKDITVGSSSKDPIEVTSADSAYPFELPYRLINMFSVYDDTVLDPFWGTGTTTLAAIISRRNSIGYELETSLLEDFEEKLAIAPSLSRKVAQKRLDDHREYLQGRDTTDYLNCEAYDCLAKTEAETKIKFYLAETLTKQQTEDVAAYKVTHRGFTGDLK